MKSIEILKTLTDERLATLLQNGQKEAMGELYNRYYTVVFCKCLSFVKNTDDAGDLTQDVMLKVMEKIKSFKGNSKFSTWLYAVTFNYCSDRARKAKSRYFISLDINTELYEPCDIYNDNTVETATKEYHASMALAAIPQEEQRLLLMKYQMNKSIQELQSIYNLSTSALKMRLLRARAKATDIYCSSLASVA